MSTFDLAAARALIADGHPADAKMACADCCPPARTRAAMATAFPAAVEEIERGRKFAAELQVGALESLDVVRSQLNATRIAIGKECVEHVELSGHIDLAEQAVDFLVNDSADSGGKAHDFAASLRIVIDQLDRQRRRANWYEAAYDAGKAKLIENAVAKIATERDAYRAMVADLLASAHPHPTEHPTMTRQWARARELLKNGKLNEPTAEQRKQEASIYLEEGLAEVAKMQAERDAARSLAIEACDLASPWAVMPPNSTKELVPRLTNVGGIDVAERIKAIRKACTP